jgi:hypothetical protein
MRRGTNTLAYFTTSSMAKKTVIQKMLDYIENDSFQLIKQSLLFAFVAVTSIILKL